LTGNAAVEAILLFNEGRKPHLVELKYERMGQDMFAFFRGTDHLFGAAWPTLKPVDPGPDILICGDLHLENLGAYRAENGDFVFDLNDFDEALVGPCSLDLVRCSTSILLAAQVWGLSPIRAVRTVLGYLDHYRSTILEAEGRGSPPDHSGPIDELIGDCALATHASQLDEYTRVDKSGVRSIQNSEGKLPAIGKKKSEAVAEAVEAYGRRIGRPDAFRVLDVSARIAGIGSLGVRRYVVLVAGDGSPHGNRLLDIKACATSSLIGCSSAAQPASWTSDALRVVGAERRLQAEPSAGLDVIAIGGKDFRLREMIPDENRATLDQFRRKPSKLRRAVEIVGRITARSQLRGARPEDGVDRTAQLARWASSPALDAVLAAAVRFAEKNREDFRAFKNSRKGMRTERKPHPSPQS
jgi:uncharacterized protein (DUF2252 family)